MANYYSRSPPPLQHPVPTHPAFIPEPPSTPGPGPASPQGYQRYQQPAQHHIPDFAAWGMDDTTAHFGMQLGQSAVAAGQEYVQKNFGGLIPLSLLKHHFNVSNSYVIKKLQLIVFPWRHRPWSRKLHRLETGQTEWQPPRDDINCPDLYIPVMALVTYILVAALQTGLQERFHPQILGASASRALVVVLLDFLFVKGGCYLLNVQGPGQVIDLIAYGGYKFVGVILTLLTGLINPGRTMYSIVFLYAFAANAFFLLRSLRSVVLPDLSSTATPVTVSHVQRKRRITFLFFEAVIQVVYMTILVRV
ncbi:YIF1 domain containing protein [Tylopilus felleus]